MRTEERSDAGLTAYLLRTACRPASDEGAAALRLLQRDMVYWNKGLGGDQILQPAGIWGHRGRTRIRFRVTTRKSTIGSGMRASTSLSLPSIRLRSEVPKRK